MRKDMYKVIVERPRRWKGQTEQAARLRDDHEGAERLGMRAGYGYRALNENLAPLRRFLLAQVGRPWDKVFSEICTGIDRRNTVQQHIHQHIDDFIATRVSVRGEELIDLSRRDWRSTAEGIWQQLYVDPRTGLIRVNKKYRAGRNHYGPNAERQKREQAELDARRRVLGERTLLLRLNELWFEVRLAELAGEPRYDAVLRRELSCPSSDAGERKRVYGSKDLYAASKRQLSKRELKAHGLSE